MTSHSTWTQNPDKSDQSHLPWSHNGNGMWSIAAEYKTTWQCLCGLDDTVHVTSYLLFPSNSIVSRYRIGGCLQNFQQSVCTQFVETYGGTLSSEDSVIWTRGMCICSTSNLWMPTYHKSIHLGYSGRCTQEEETQLVSDMPQQRVCTYAMRMNVEHFIRAYTLYLSAAYLSRYFETSLARVEKMAVLKWDVRKCRSDTSSR